jgi:hypothetical protein
MCIGKHTKGDITDLACAGRVESRNILELQGWIIPEENLWSVLDSSSPSVHEFLPEQSLDASMD